MEQKANLSEDKCTWFVIAVSPGDPVSGWSFNTGTEQVEILRREGETDEELEQRAATAARKCLGEDRTPILISFSENDLNCL